MEEFARIIGVRPDRYQIRGTPMLAVQGATRVIETYAEWGMWDETACWEVTKSRRVF